MDKYIDKIDTSFRYVKCAFEDLQKCLVYDYNIRTSIKITDAIYEIRYELFEFEIRLRALRDKIENG